MVSYNAADHLRRTLAALTGPAAPAAAHEVLLTDNASADGAADVAEHFLGPAAVLRLDRNTGFGHAVNRGVERARGEFVLLLNPDAEPEPGAVDTLLAHLRAHPDHGVVGGRYRTPDGGADPRSCFGRITLWSLTCGALGLSVVARGSRLFDPEALGGWDRTTPRHVDVVSGGFLLVSRALWDRLGGFDELFRIYGEDQDLCLRAARLGYRPSMTPDAVVVHDIGASSTSRAGRDVLVLCGRATVVQRHYRGPARRYGLGALALGVLLRATAERALRRPGRWSEVWRRRAEWASGWSPSLPLPGERVAA
ncbi:hypothetical protein BJP25_29890 [Actinokineospora bangkokensis]|uniref:Glycosyltransferase 2-like domain-containing protein n=2 Tax=Actinokineospora bangkokensis TaxID=1193682 RepID=A0A1Q9LGN9_9PSEU|nr:hypothetical protein BJP25_29890 [Actinokineospora bangkokensis]